MGKVRIELHDFVKQNENNRTDLEIAAKKLRIMDLDATRHIRKYFYGDN